MRHKETSKRKQREIPVAEDMTQPGVLNDEVFARLTEYLDLERRKIFHTLSRAEQLFVLHQIWVAQNS
jgi:hypothetical protein